MKVELIRLFRKKGAAIHHIVDSQLRNDFVAGPPLDYCIELM
jgi:hypothetical protein